MEVVACSVVEFVVFDAVDIRAGGEACAVNKPDASGVVENGTVVYGSGHGCASGQGGLSAILLAPIVVLRHSDVKHKEKKNCKQMFVHDRCIAPSAGVRFKRCYSDAKI